MYERGKSKTVCCIHSVIRSDEHHVCMCMPGTYGGHIHLFWDDAKRQHHDIFHKHRSQIPIMLAVISFIELLITNIRKKKGK